MPWKFGLLKLDSSYHSKMLRNHLIDAAVNCVNLIAAGMLLYVVIVYTMQGSIKMKNASRNYPGERSPKHFSDDMHYNQHLAHEHKRWENWNENEFLYTPENPPPQCRQDICPRFKASHRMLGHLDVYSAPTSGFAIFKCPHGAAWNSSMTAYGYWLCGQCGIDDEDPKVDCSRTSWSAQSDKMKIDSCALSDPNMQFLNEVRYRVKLLARSHSRIFSTFLEQIPSVPIGKTDNQRLSSEMCADALMQFDFLSNATLDYGYSNKVCSYSLELSLNLLQWIINSCEELNHKDEFFNELILSLTGLADSNCFWNVVENFPDENGFKNCCVVDDKENDSCQKTNCAAINACNGACNVNSLLHHVYTFDRDVSSLGLTKLMLVQVWDNVSHSGWLKLKVPPATSKCYFTTTGEFLLDKQLLSVPASNHTCMFDLSKNFGRSFVVFLSDAGNEMKLTGSEGSSAVSVDTQHSSASSGFRGSFKDALYSRLKTEVLRLHREYKKFEPPKKSSLVFYPSLATLDFLSYLLSLICLLATLATYGLFPKLRTERTPTKILLTLCTCSSLYILTMCITMFFVSTSMGCQFALVMRVYLTLVTLTWCSIEAFNLYLVMLGIFPAHMDGFMRKALIVGLGLPAAIVFIPVAVHPELFTGSFSGCDWVCKFPDITHQYLFVLPIGLGAFLNLVVYCMAAKFYFSQHELHISEPRRVLWNEIKACGGLFVILVMSSVFSGFSIINYTSKGPSLVTSFEVFSHVLYTISIAGQGLYVFVVYCVSPPDARKQWIQIWKSLYVSRSNWSISSSNSKKTSISSSVHLQARRKGSGSSKASMKNRNKTTSASGGKNLNMYRKPPAVQATINLNSAASADGGGGSTSKRFNFSEA